MNESNGFIGMGHNPNPHVPDIPLGFGMALFQSPTARSYFESLSDSQKTRLINYIQDNVTGEEAEHKIIDAVERLEQKTIDFIS